MTSFLLLMTIITQENYNRGFGDGIAASKSASAAIHSVSFRTKETCEKVKQVFIDQTKLKLKREKGESVSRIEASCIEI